MKLSPTPVNNNTARKKSRISETWKKNVLKKQRVTVTMKTQLLLLSVLYCVTSQPLTTLEDLEVVDDRWSVGSYVRVVRAAAPEHYHKSYENEGDGEVGYSRKKSGGGKKGYQHFDSYHKKAGDNYEFEKQDSFGLDKEEQDSAHSHRHERKAKREREPEYEEEDVEYVEDEKRKEKKKHRHHEELKEGASDGNGGVEAYGHDIRDYILPEKYTWGKDDEDFKF